MPDKDKILDILKKVTYGAPISGLQISDAGEVLFCIEVDPAIGSAMEDMRIAAEEAISKIGGVTNVTAILTSRNPAAAPTDPHGMNKNPPLTLPIKKIIAVASGKGGVGKSTVAFNLAYALGKAGQKVGLLDADIYGPSVPLLSGLQGQKPSPPQSPPQAGGKDAQRQGGEKLIPLEAHGLKLMSIGFLSGGDQAMIWRGPMVQTAIYQMLRDVDWGREDDPLDVLMIDMPPGTGDAQLTLAQKVPVTGAVIVSTPQDLALIDARKAVQMFEKTNVPVLGLIENMSRYCCPECGYEDAIFGTGGAKAEAAKIGVPFLGAIPLNSDIRAKSDRGEPLELDVFEEIASLLRGGL